MKQNHYQELKQSAIADDVIELNFNSLDGYNGFANFVSLCNQPDKREGRQVCDTNTNHRYSHLYEGYWYANSWCPLTNTVDFKQVKPDYPMLRLVTTQGEGKYKQPVSLNHRPDKRYFPSEQGYLWGTRQTIIDLAKALNIADKLPMDESGKWHLEAISAMSPSEKYQWCYQNGAFDVFAFDTIKYETPTGNGTPFIYINIPLRVLEEIATEYDLTLPEGYENWTVDDKWRWIKNHPQIPIFITEGTKKAASLISHGKIAIASFSITTHSEKASENKSSWVTNLKPDLLWLLEKNSGRLIYLVFDVADIKESSRKAVKRETKKIAKKLKKYGIVKIITWQDEFCKGIDDFLVKYGIKGLNKIIHEATDFNKLWQKETANYGRKLTSNLLINQRYLSANLFTSARQKGVKLLCVKSQQNTAKSYSYADFLKEIRQQSKTKAKTEHINSSNQQDFERRNENLDKQNNYPTEPLINNQNLATPDYQFNNNSEFNNNNLLFNSYFNLTDSNLLFNNSLNLANNNISFSNYFNLTNSNLRFNNYFNLDNSNLPFNNYSNLVDSNSKLDNSNLESDNNSNLDKNNFQSNHNFNLDNKNSEPSYQNFSLNNEQKNSQYLDINSLNQSSKVNHLNHLSNSNQNNQPFVNSNQFSNSNYYHEFTDLNNNNNNYQFPSNSNNQSLNINHQNSQNSVNPNQFSNFNDYNQFSNLNNNNNNNQSFIKYNNQLSNINSLNNQSSINNTQISNFNHYNQFSSNSNNQLSNINNQNNQSSGNYNNQSININNQNQPSLNQYYLPSTKSRLSSTNSHLYSLGDRVKIQVNFDIYDSVILGYNFANQKYQCEFHHGFIERDISQIISNNNGDKLPKKLITYALTHRQSLAWNLADKFELDCYLSNVIKFENHGIVACADSALMIPENQKFTNMVIDESEQVSWHLLASNTEISKNRINKIMRISHHGKIVLSNNGMITILDADLSDIGVKFYQFLFGVSDEDTLIVENTYKPFKGIRNCYLYNKVESLRNDIISAIRNNQRVIIHTSGQKESSTHGTINIEKEILAVFPELESKIYRLDKKSLGDSTHFSYQILSDLDKLKEAQVVIASSCINTGVSLDEEIVGTFDGVYGIFYGNYPLTDFEQAIERYRGNCHRYIYIKNASSERINLGSYKYSDLLNNIMGQTNNIQNLLQDDFNCDLALDLVKFYCKFATRINNDYIHLKSNFISHLEDKGYTILDGKQIDKDEAKALKEMYQFIRDESENDFQTQVFKQPIPSPQRLEELERSKTKTHEENIEEYKGQLARKYRTNQITRELIGLDRDGYFPQLLLQFWLSMDLDLVTKRDKRVLTKYSENNDHFGYAVDFNRQSISTQVFLLNHIGFNDTISKFLNIQAQEILILLLSMQFNPIWFKCVDMNKLAGLITESDVIPHLWFQDSPMVKIAFKQVLNIDLDKNHSPIQLLRMILKRIGYKIESVGRLGARNNRKRYYRITSCISDELMTEIFDNWLQHELVENAQFENEDKIVA